MQSKNWNKRSLKSRIKRLQEAIKPQQYTHIVVSQTIEQYLDTNPCQLPDDVIAHALRDNPKLEHRYIIIQAYTPEELAQIAEERKKQVS